MVSPSSLAAAAAPSFAAAPPADGPTGASLLAAAATLARREIVRFFRQRSRILGALSSPLLFWLLIGSGLNRSFRMGDGADSITYMTYFYVGTTALVMLFTAILSMISIIEDRKEGFLQGVLVAPVPRGAIVVGKIAGGTAIALIQGGLFLLLAPLAGFDLTPTKFVALMGVLALLGFSLSGLGYLIAWKMDSTQGFHVLLNLVLMPMWILSGSVFPLEGATAWVRWLMLANPLTYGVDALRIVFHHGHEHAYVSPLPTSLGGDLFVVAAFGAVMIAIAARVTSRREA